MKYLGWAFPLGNFMFINMLFILGLFFSFIWIIEWICQDPQKILLVILFEFIELQISWGEN